MPNPSEYEDKEEWMNVCVPKMMGEGKDNEQAVAACMGMWIDKQDAAKYRSSLLAVKAVGDWELDIRAVPFHSMDSDRQYFDEDTDVMPDVFKTPFIAYQHGIEQGAKRIQDKPVKLGAAVEGTLKKQMDGWHIRVVLDKAVKQAKTIMDAAHKGMVAVSSGSIAHLARLDVGGKLIQYEKNRPGRIAVWALGEISLWERGNGNVQPANQYAVALPVMKAIYRDAGIPFPEIDTNGVSQADNALKRARIDEVRNKSKLILKKMEK